MIRFLKVGKMKLQNVGCLMNNSQQKVNTRLVTWMEPQISLATDKQSKAESDLVIGSKPNESITLVLETKAKDLFNLWFIVL